MLVVAPQQKVEGQNTQKYAAIGTTENQENGRFLKYKPFISWESVFFFFNASSSFKNSVFWRASFQGTAKMSAIRKALRQNM